MVCVHCCFTVVFVRFVSVRCIRRGAVRFGSVRGRCGSWRFVSAAGSVHRLRIVRSGSFRLGSCEVRLVPVRFVRFVVFFAVRFGSQRFGSVYAVRFGSAAILIYIYIYTYMSELINPATRNY